MTLRNAEFFSDGLRLSATLHLPAWATRGARAPAVVICSGRMGLKDWLPLRWSRFFIDAGFACLAFDYRNLGSSEGERGRLLPEEEVRDLFHAVTFLLQQPEIDSARIGLAGFGLGGAVAVAAAARDDRVGAVACINGVGDNGRVARNAATPEAWRAREAAIEADRIKRVLRGSSDYIPYDDVVHPGHVAGNVSDFKSVLEQAVGKEEAKGSGLGHGLPDRFTLESAEALYAFRPEEEVHRISPRPLLIVHAENDDYYPLDEARNLFRHAGEPRTLKVLPGAGHLDWTAATHPQFEPTLSEIAGWFRDAIGSGEGAKA